jgi:hypothetical protein
MTGRVDQRLPRARSWSPLLSLRCSARSFGEAVRRARAVGWEWVGRTAVVLGWAFVMLLVGTAVLLAVATAAGYQWPGLSSPAQPMPLTPEPGF